MAPGRYLIKAYVDSQRRLSEDPVQFLGPADFCGQAELIEARWREGFRHAEWISGATLTKP